MLYYVKSLKTQQNKVRIDMPEEMPPILDTALAAELLNMNVDVVRRMAREGELPAYRLPGARSFRFFRDELMEYVRSFPVHPADGQEETSETPAG